MPIGWLQEMSICCTWLAQEEHARLHYVRPSLPWDRRRDSTSHPHGSHRLPAGCCADYQGAGEAAEARPV